MACYWTEALIAEGNPSAACDVMQAAVARGSSAAITDVDDVKITHACALAVAGWRGRLQLLPCPEYSCRSPLLAGHFSSAKEILGKGEVEGGGSAALCLAYIALRCELLLFFDRHLLMEVQGRG